MINSLTMLTVGDIVSISSSSDRSAILTEFKSAMSSKSSSPVKVVRVFPKAFNLFPMLGSMCTSMPHIFHSTLRVHVPALLLSVSTENGEMYQDYDFQKLKTGACKTKIGCCINPFKTIFILLPDMLRNI